MCAGRRGEPDCLLIRTETSDPASPPVRGSGLRSTVQQRLSGPATGNYRLSAELTSTPFTLRYLQEEVRWEDLGIFVCLLTMMRWGLSSVVLLHQDIFISFWAKHLLYSNEKSYWELHVVETEKREVLCKYCKYKDLPDILAQITKISFWNINTP